ncbi:virulence-associated E family protein [Heliorestis convoluta]|uniref:Phage-like protein, putative n=1 Tax=Heliorestis convoluta TaxID=356322 RepID=A0A5Q2MXN5_9FIRM|nr:virulence-associated E family protein [Heliorestis convoluta]QGG47327.1 phage-like protein, putative [Heliorestis convoluta]
MIANPQKVKSLEHDGLLTIAIGRSRKDRSWKNREMSWLELVNRLSNTIRTPEKYEEYKKLSKAKQDEVKDVGGFVGGTLKGGRRKNNSVVWRQLITLDADYVKGDLWASVETIFGHGCAIYSTHKHHPTKPRLRLVIPLLRPVTADEYVPIARRIAADLGIDFFDDTTFQVHRLMYWPSTPADGDFVFKVLDEPWVDPDVILARYPDWQDSSFWPESSRTLSERKKLADKQGDPKGKAGIVGAFCRTYSVTEVIEKYLSDRYTPCDDPNRYTYSAGSTSGGLVIYENGDFAYSHHSTDPIGGKLCNAFDLARIHLFGDLDESVKEGTPINRLPSYQAMTEEALKDKQVKLTMGKEQLNLAEEEFQEEELEWLTELTRDQKGNVLSTAPNVILILENDRALKERIALNDFVHRVVIKDDLPWRSRARGDYWTDSDDASLRNYLYSLYGIKGAGIIADAWSEVAVKHAFHPIKDYLSSLVWDGRKRIERIMIDYLGADDNECVRTFTRKILVAAVTRIYRPGAKFDYSVVLVGPQGIGKSYIIKRLGKDWHSDSFITVKGKEAYEQLQGVWILEMAELTATKKVDVEAVKHFISKSEDTFRVAYGRHNETFKRQCVFFGTTNDYDFLNDPTGNRRFLPITVNGGGSKNMWVDLTDEEVDQIWAEAKVLYEQGESLALSKEIEEKAQMIQAAHTQENPIAESIRTYLETSVPTNWYELDIGTRRAYLHLRQGDSQPEKTMKLNKVCAQMVWEELFQKDISTMTRYDAKEINMIILHTPGWKRVSSVRFDQTYGMQKGFRRENVYL